MPHALQTRQVEGQEHGLVAGVLLQLLNHSDRGVAIARGDVDFGLMTEESSDGLFAYASIAT